jgi:hypothetical protein
LYTNHTGDYTLKKHAPFKYDQHHRFALKELSSEMDQVEIRFTRKVFIKERGVEVFRKICLPPSCESPTAPTRTAVGYLEIVFADEFIAPLPILRTFIASLPTENNNILGLKCSLRQLETDQI